MSTFYSEGTADYVARYPAVILSFKASGSITAGRLVVYDLSNSSMVYQATVAIGGLVPVGLALQTTADGGSVPVLVWGVAKNCKFAKTDETLYPGQNLTISGAGYFTSGSTYVIGRAISGSASSFTAFIDCFKIITTD